MALVVGLISASACEEGVYKLCAFMVCLIHVESVSYY